MSRIDRRDLTCPLCETAFAGWLVMAAPSGGPKSTDLRQYTEGEDPIPKQINGCPGCGFTGEASSFEELAPEGSLPIDAKRCGAFWDQGSWDDAHDPLVADRPSPSPSTLKAEVDRYLWATAARAHEQPALRYEHHAQVSRWSGAGPLREGDAWLRAAWLHGDAEAKDDTLRCQRRALHCYRQAVAEKTWFRRREDLVVVAYLIAELHRRLAEPDEAARWYDQVETWAEGLKNLAELVELAKRQKTDPREVI